MKMVRHGKCLRVSKSFQNYHSVEQMWKSFWMSHESTFQIKVANTNYFFWFHLKRYFSCEKLVLTEADICRITHRLPETKSNLITKVKYLPSYCYNFSTLWLYLAKYWIAKTWNKFISERFILDLFPKYVFTMDRHIFNIRVLLTWLIVKLYSINGCWFYVTF